MRIELPQPSADERVHSERLAAVIRAEIAAAGGALDFARYMELALYAPGLGYYSAGATKFGATGDFVTAPELGSLFARCLARAVAPVLRAFDHAEILELGPGSGALAAELLLEFERLGVTVPGYRMLERSADLRVRQQETLRTRCPHLADCVRWLDAPPVEPWHGILLANEVADALPVRIFALRDEGIHARGVGVDGAGRFIWRERPADAEFAAAVTHTLGAAMAALPRPYSSVISTMLQPWFAAVAGALAAGLALCIDYGYPRSEYYLPQRRTGTLRCHYRHRAHDDPLIWPGLQDITAWVDFSALAQAGRRAGFELIGYTTQAQFLLANGLPELFTAMSGQVPDAIVGYRLAQEVKRLTLPGEMGERFQVIGFGRFPRSAAPFGLGGVDLRARL